MLPTKPAAISRNMHEYHWLIYGQPKIGKSTFASQFNKPLFIATEDRLKSLEVFKMPAVGCVKNWMEFLMICREIEEAISKNKFPYSMIVVDTVDEALIMCSEYICTKHDMQHPSDKGYGKGWGFVTNEFIRVMKKLTSYGRGVIFVTHSVEKEVETRVSKLTKIMPCIGGQAGERLSKMVDIIAYIGFDADNTDERLIYLRGHEGLEAGDTTNSLPPKMPFDYKQIEAEFMKKNETKEKK